MHSKRAIVIEYVNDDILQVNEYMDDTKSIYSIDSIEDNFEQELSSESENELTIELLESNKKFKEDYYNQMKNLENMDNILENLVETIYEHNW